MVTDRPNQPKLKIVTAPSEKPFEALWDWLLTPDAAPKDTSEEVEGHESHQ